jgi:hypothetical protein
MELLFSARVYRALVHLLTRPAPGELPAAPLDGDAPEVDGPVPFPADQLA